MSNGDMKAECTVCPPSNKVTTCFKKSFPIAILFSWEYSDQRSRNTSRTHFLPSYVCKLGWCRCPRLLRSSGTIRESFETHTIRFQILIPHPETHSGLTFDAPVRISSVARGNKNPDAGLECKNLST
ncbi:hypothetical protein TNCV_2555701 [Trichonephila clavipes]|nr:hypothetical protein TNCV_2555701 [Trichonephila clavipes]